MLAYFMLARVCTRRNALSAGVLYACKGAHTLLTNQRERKREYSFLKGMTGEVAPFSYLVLNKSGKTCQGLTP
jgi:hypothetical protein